MRENGAGGRAKEGGSDDAQQGGVDGSEGERTVVTEEGVRGDVSTRTQQDTGGQSSGAVSENVGDTGNRDTGREDGSGVRTAQAEGTQWTREEEGIMTREEIEEVERDRTEVEEVVSSEQWAEEVAHEMEYEGGSETAQESSMQYSQEQQEQEEQRSETEQVRERTELTEVRPVEQEESGEVVDSSMEDTAGREGSGSMEHTAQAAAVTGSMESEQPTQGVSMSAGESMHMNSEIREGTHQEVDGGGSANAEPRRSEEDNDDEWSVEDGGSDKDNNDNGEDSILDGSDGKSSRENLGVTSGSASGYEGRARRGVSKAGGYAEVTKRRGPRKKAGVRIRYVDDDERGGGTTEQGIRMGPVSVWRVAHGHRSEVRGAATPLRDPG